jgi:hypothetical protein
VVFLSLLLSLFVVAGCGTLAGDGGRQSILEVIAQAEKIEAIYGKEIYIKASHDSSFAGRTDIEYRSRFRGILLPSLSQSPPIRERPFSWE